MVDYNTRNIFQGNICQNPKTTIFQTDVKTKKQFLRQKNKMPVFLFRTKYLPNQNSQPKMKISLKFLSVRQIPTMIQSLLIRRIVTQWQRSSDLFYFWCLINNLMIPFQKIFTLLIRTFSRPMLHYFKQKQKLKESSLVGRFFIGFGRKTLAAQHWVNHRMLKTLTPKRHKQLSEEFLLEKGV